MTATAEQSLSRFLAHRTLERARSLFPHTRGTKNYLNHAASAPMSTRVIDAINYHLQQRSIGAIDTYMALDVAKIEECRQRVQALINAESPERIALMINTSDPLNIIASGLEWKSGDRILLHEAEFPANVWPYLALKRHGVEIDIIPQQLGHPTPQLIADSLTPRTKVVALSEVQFLTGYRADIEAIGTLCRSKDILFVVDGIQAVGAVKVDVQQAKVDGYAAGCQKWQLGPQGTGWLYLTEELQSRIQPAHVGWLAVEHPWNFTDFHQPLASSARRYEGGTKNIPGLWGMEAALSILLEFGLEEIEQHILALTELLINGLQRMDGVRIVSPLSQTDRAGIVTIECAAAVDTKVVFERLLEREITISLREGKLRFSPHFYNTPSEIENAISALAEAIA
jgi:selenocysteine lyase/cysteine desulfurase